ncbi:ATP synthase F1 subunit gamma [bacterium]|nr:ATP synthase F1 subunit gamma [bacterium]
MPGVKEIKRRITSISNIKQITRAMKLIATAKLQKAQSSLLVFRPYARTLREMLGNLSVRCERELHPLLEQRPVRKKLILAVTSNRGLCGPFNRSILERAEKFVKESDLPVCLGLVGKKAAQYFKRREMEISFAQNLPDPVTYKEVEEITAKITEAYTNEECDEVYLLVNKFKNVMVQIPTFVKLLPLSIEKIEQDNQITTDYLYEPGPEAIFNELLPRYLNVQIYRMLLESTVSEHSARMLAMDNATRSANDMIDELTLSFNKARQAGITKEITEIVTGIGALAE